MGCAQGPTLTMIVVSTIPSGNTRSVPPLASTKNGVTATLSSIMYKANVTSSNTEGVPR